MMDSISAAIIAALKVGINDTGKVVIKDAYMALKRALQHKFGNRSQVVDTVVELEKKPDSSGRQTILQEEIETIKAVEDPQLKQLALSVLKKLGKTPEGRKIFEKYDITAEKIGVVKENIHISGGLHFYDSSGGKASQSSTSFKEAADRKVDEQDPVRMHILHLSDLHFGTTEDAERWYSQLAEDLKQELGCRRLNAVIISGDMANFAVEAEYAAAKIFIDGMCKEFDIDQSNLVMVPGNHDLNRELSEDSYIPVKRKNHEEDLQEGCYINESESVIQIRDDQIYKKRFSPFSRFYEQVKGVPYPLDPSQQAVIYHLRKHDLLILGLNSVWQVDHHFTTRAGICPEALSLALDEIRQTPAYAASLKWAVWHHPISSSFDDRMVDHGFMERLAQNGFSVCFHGHLHKTSGELFRFDYSSCGRKIEIVGAGTFGAPTSEWTPGYPLQYNLLKVTHNQVIVETRCRMEINGAWKPDARWTQGPGLDPLPRYFIPLRQEPAPALSPEPQPHRSLTDYQPGGALDAQCPFYIEREADAEVLAGVCRHRGLVTLYGPGQTGKTSMMLRLYARICEPQSSLRPVILDFQGLSRDRFESLETIWQAILAAVDGQLKIGALNEGAWNSNANYDHNLSAYLEQFVFANDPTPLLFCLDEVNRVFRKPVRYDFFSSVRAFFNRGAFDSTWEKIHWLLSTSSEPRFFIDDLNQSPFNVGINISLRAFTFDETTEFIHRYGVSPDSDRIGRIMTYLGGRPYLVHLLLHHLVRKPECEERLFHADSAGGGVFKAHLDRYLVKFQDQRDLAIAMKQVIAGKGCTNVRMADRLSAAGLVKEDSKGIIICACQLYTDYLGKRL
jgi:hypothetical protein